MQEKQNFCAFSFAELNFLDEIYYGTGVSWCDSS